MAIVRLYLDLYVRSFIGCSVAMSSVESGSIESYTFLEYSSLEWPGETKACVLRCKMGSFNSILDRTSCESLLTHPARPSSYKLLYSQCYDTKEHKEPRRRNLNHVEAKDGTCQGFGVLLRRNVVVSVIYGVLIQMYLGRRERVWGVYSVRL